MARQTVFLVLIISLPILISVITAFRVRDLPRNEEKKHEKCDGCDRVSESQQFHRHNNKVEPSYRSYEQMKKALRDKQQKNKFNIKSSISSVGDDEDDDDENELPALTHTQVKGSKEIKGTSEKNIKDKTISSAEKIFEIADDDDDDDDDDDFEIRWKITEPHIKMSSIQSKGKQSIENKNKNDNEEDDDDDDDDEDDDDDSIGSSYKIDKTIRPNSIEKTEKSKSLKNPVIKKPFKSVQKHLEIDEEYDDNDDDEHDKISVSKARISQEKTKTEIKQTKITMKDDDDDDDDENNDVDDDSSQMFIKKEKIVKIKGKEKSNHESNVQAKSQKDNDDDDDDEDDDYDKNDAKKTKDKKNIDRPTPEKKHQQKKEKTEYFKENERNNKENSEPGTQIKQKVDKSGDKKVTETKVKEKSDVKSALKEESKSEHKTSVQGDQPKKKVVDESATKLVIKTKKEEHKQDVPLKPKELEKNDQKPKSTSDIKREKSNEEHVSHKKEERKPLPDVRKSHESSWEWPSFTWSESVEELHILKDSREKKDDAKDIIIKSDGVETASDVLRRKNLLQSDFEDFYTFFPTFAPNFSRIHNAECRRHGQILLRQLRGTKLWALNMLDATAKIPSGLLQGNGIQLGDFDQCLGSRARVQLETGSVVKVQGKYCLVLVDVKAEHPELEVPVYLAQARNLIKSRIDDPGHFIPRFSTLSWGVCVPAACEPEDVEVVARDAIKHYQHTSGIVIKVKVDPDDCYTDEGEDWWEEWMELPTLLTLTFYGIIILLVFVATIQDFFTRRQSNEDKPRDEGNDDKEENEMKEGEEETKEEKEPKKRAGGGILSSFSLYTTLGKLIAESSEEISCIHGVRAIATVALLVAHKFIAVAVTPYSNRIKITEEASSPLWSWSRAGWMYTDCFLLLSGVLLANRISTDSEVGAPRRLLNRYLRLTPALLAVVLFYAYIWDKLSAGPRWGTLVTKNSNICQEGWWWNLLYIQNFFGLEDLCAPHTHQLALDMQLTILGGMLVWISQVKPGVFRILLPSICAVAAYLRYSTVQEHRLTMLAYHGVSISQLYRTARLSYISTIHRCTPYLVGISLGLSLQKPSRHNKLFLILGWLISISFWSLVWWSGFDSGSTQYRYNVQDAAQYAALAPIASAIAIAWVIYVVHNGYCEWLSNILCSRPLVLISKLSYALYLIQFVIFFTNAATVRASSEFTLISLLDVKEISAIVLSATLLTVTFVTPMQSFHKISLFTTSDITENKECNGEVKEESEDQEKEPDDGNGVDIKNNNRINFLAHRELLEEIPEAEVEYEIQRDRDEGLEEILEEEEYAVEDEEVDNEDAETVIEEEIHLEELEVIMEEQGGEDDFWADRNEDELPRRSYSPNEDDELEEWEWTNERSRLGNSDNSYNHRYSR